MMTILASGCGPVLKQVTVASATEIFRDGMAAFYREEDLILAEQALASNLKLLEVFLEASPDNPDLLLQASQGFGAYTFAFVEDKITRHHRDPHRIEAHRERARRPPPQRPCALPERGSARAWHEPRPPPTRGCPRPLLDGLRMGRIYPLEPRPAGDAGRSPPRPGDDGPGLGDRRAVLFCRGPPLLRRLLRVEIAGPRRGSGARQVTSRPGPGAGGTNHPHGATVPRGSVCDPGPGPHTLRDPTPADPRCSRRPLPRLSAAQPSGQGPRATAAGED